MSLRGFHLFFIAIAVLLALWLAVYEYQAFQQGRSAIDLAVCIFEVVLAVAMTVYGVSFRRKTKGM